MQLLVDEGLLVGTESEGSKKLFELTDAGRQAAEKVETPPWDEIADGVDPAQLNLRAAIGQLFGAVAQSAHAASTEQQQRIIDIVNNARREIYGSSAKTTDRDPRRRGPSTYWSPPSTRQDTSTQSRVR